MPYVIGKLEGRCGNQFYQIATSYAYARKHGFQHFVTSPAMYNGSEDDYYFKNFPTLDTSVNQYGEQRDRVGYTIYVDIPRIEDVMLIGYWQTFRYFDEYREELIKLFNLPYQKKMGYVSIHVRRGDYILKGNNEYNLTINYYKNCISYFIERGYKKFLVFSDDIEWCKNNFNKQMYESIDFEFSEGRGVLEDLSLMSCCEHNIVANSTFSYCASWFNQNKDKIILTPDLLHFFDNCNADMIPPNYIQIND